MNTVLSLTHTQKLHAQEEFVLVKPQGKELYVYSVHRIDCIDE